MYFYVQEMNYIINCIRVIKYISVYGKKNEK